MAQSYTYFEDPGHAWLRVPLIEICPIQDKISHYSYMKGKYAYLEEDCDAILFLKHKFGENLSYAELTEKGIIKTKYVEKTNIRNYEIFKIRTKEEKELMEKVINALLLMNFKKREKKHIEKASYEDCLYWKDYYNIS